MSIQHKISELQTKLATESDDRQLKITASKGIMWIREFNRHLNLHLDSGVTVLSEDEERQLDNLLNKLDHMLVKIEKEL